jgi:hypothetical protein
VGDYVDHIKKYGQQLTDKGYKLDDWILTSMLLHNLGDAYDPFVASTLQAVRNTEPDFDVIVHQLIDEERRKHNGDSGMALFTKGRKKNFGGKPDSKKNASIICHHCEKSGHVKADCWKLHPEKAPQKKSQNPEQSKGGQKGDGSVLMAVSSPLQHRAIWHIDSGATDHMCQSKDAFESYSSMQKKVYMADGKHTMAIGIGSVVLYVVQPEGTERSPSQMFYTHQSYQQTCCR